MKIVNRTEFLSMPTPFMYVKCDNYGNSDGDMCINCGTTTSKKDWFYNSCILEPDSNDSNERWNKWFKMLDDSSLDLPVIADDIKRDGRFDNDQRFIVFSRDDFKTLIDMLQSYLGTYSGGPDHELYGIEE